jgi:hypothetical protein
MRWTCFELVFPSEWGVSSNYLIILSEAEHQCILVGVTGLVEVFYAEIMLACSED